MGGYSAWKLEEPDDIHSHRQGTLHLGVAPSPNTGVIFFSQVLQGKPGIYLPFAPPGVLSGFSSLFSPWAG